MSQDVSPGIAKELTSPRKNAQIRKCTQDWSPISVNLKERVSPSISRWFGKCVRDDVPVGQDGR